MRVSNPSTIGRKKREYFDQSWRRVRSVSSGKVVSVLRTRMRESARRIGSNILKRRNAVGLTQLQLADKLGLASEASICHYERGNRHPGPTRLKELAKALYTTTDELLKGREV